MFSSMRADVLKELHVAIGFQGDAKLLGGPDLRDGGDIEGMGRQRGERGFFALPKLTGALAGLPMHAPIGDGVESVLGDRR
jgi:hypothetical protein